jgi:hypothetical protein
MCFFYLSGIQQNYTSIPTLQLKVALYLGSGHQTHLGALYPICMFLLILFLRKDEDDKPSEQI